MTSPVHGAGVLPDANAAPRSVGAGWKDRRMREITDGQRRARLGARHALAARVESVEEAVEAVTCLHATEAPSVYLSVVARADSASRRHRPALYDDRSVVKQLAMRRTLFAFPRDLLPHVWGSASDRVAQQLQHPAGQGGRGQRDRQARRGLAHPDEQRRARRAGRGRAGHHRRAARADPDRWPGVWTWRPASPTARTSRSHRGCSARSRPPARSCAATTRATGAPRGRAGR